MASEASTTTTISLHPTFIQKHSVSVSLFFSAFILLVSVMFVDETTQSQTTPLLSSFGLYPNVLNISAEDRASFHPVVIFPKVKVVEISSPSTQETVVMQHLQVMDFTQATADRQLATELERVDRKNNRGPLHNLSTIKKHAVFAVGRYDENRVGLYESALFDDTANDIDGYNGRRSVHMGIDLDGPVATKVYAFADGRVHSAGYNAELGDYGYVVVIEHDLPAAGGHSRLLYALYGHLNDGSIRGMLPGKRIKRGQLIGRMGDIHENGAFHLTMMQ